MNQLKKCVFYKYKNKIFYKKNDIIICHNNNIKREKEFDDMFTNINMKNSNSIKNIKLKYIHQEMTKDDFFMN